MIKGTQMFENVKVFEEFKAYKLFKNICLLMSSKLSNHLA